MKSIFLHGLGQDSSSFDEIKEELKEEFPDLIFPNLFELDSQIETYDDLINAFTEFCNRSKEKVNLVGLSLGGVLAIDYTVRFSNKVNSVVLIGTPYQIPKMLFKIQTILFKLMPESTFRKMGWKKKNFFFFIKSMSKINLSHHLHKITCPALIVCGNRDYANKKSAKQLKEHIQNSSLKLISKSGHEVNRANPQMLAKTIRDFFKKNG